MNDDDATDAARRWLMGGYRTWRWNDGSYAEKNRYDAVETTEAGLVYFGFDGAGEGFTYRQEQSYERFTAEGPARALPAAVRAELERWCVERLARAGS